MFIYVLTDENNVITAYGFSDHLENSIELEVEEIPEDLILGYYKLTESAIVVDEELKGQIDATPDPLTDIQQLQMQNALLNKELLKQTQINTTMAKTQASVIKQLLEKGVL